MMTNIIIETKDITLYRNDSKIFEGISLDIEKTKLLNIFGRNGSGKTSLLKILTGVTEPTSGIVLNRSDDESLYEKIIYVGHKSGLKNNLTVNENLYYFIKPEEQNKTTKIDRALEIYQMMHCKNILVKNLSHGQQKKVSLMKTIIADAKVWILDEPYSALDAESIKIFDMTIENYIKQEGSVVVTNHKKITENSWSKNYQLN